MRALDRDPGLALADRWQRDFPIVERPFALVGALCDMTERETLSTFKRLTNIGYLGRVGPVVRPHSAGASTLAAAAVPKTRLEDVARLVSAEAYVNHNYERDHAINLWFVVAAPDEDRLRKTLARISDRSGLEVFSFPLVEPYHIDLGFQLDGGPRRPMGPQHGIRPATAQERELLAVLEDGLPLVARPYEAVAQRMGWAEHEIMRSLESMSRDGVLSRFGCVLRHRRLGYTANAMAVWDVDDSRVSALGAALATSNDVTLCYRRHRARPAWPYNLYVMVHGCDETRVRSTIAALAARHGLDAFPSDVLFSRRCFLQRGARFSGDVAERAA